MRRKRRSYCSHVDDNDDGRHDGVTTGNNHLMMRMRSKLRVALHDYINAYVPISEAMMDHRNCSHDSRPDQQMNNTTTATTDTAVVVRINKNNHDVIATIYRREYVVS